MWGGGGGGGGWGERPFSSRILTRPKQLTRITETEK